MQTGHRRFIPSAGSAQSASSLLCSPRKVRERQSCKWRLCPTEGSCADLTPGQSLHLLAKSPLEKNIESSLPQPLQSGDWPVKEPTFLVEPKTFDCRSKRCRSRLKRTGDGNNARPSDSEP